MTPDRTGRLRVPYGIRGAAVSHRLCDETGAPMQRDELFCEEVPSTIELTGQTASSPEPADLEVRWLTLELLELIGGHPREARHLNSRTILLGVESCADAGAPEPTATGQVTRGVYLMSYGLYRPALRQFERALDGRIDEALEPIARLALEAHAFSLLRIGCERDAREEFERLIRRQLGEGAEPAPAALDHVTELVGILRISGALEA